MSEFTSINIMGVPEHFNLPWYLAIESGSFSEAGIDLQWKDAPGGTGAMMQALTSGETDMVVALTEGVATHIAKGAAARIVQLYVSTPLRWGIHVAAHSSYQQVEKLADSRFAISRPASGSHLMAYVLGREQQWNTRKMKFVEVGGMAGAQEALAAGTADTFLWEQLMTKPIVDRGEFRRLGHIDTPWPCFVIAASQQLIDEQPQALDKLLQVIRQQAPAFKKREDAVERITGRFALETADVVNWLERTEWANHRQISLAMLEEVLDTLQKIEAVPKPVKPQELCSERHIEIF